MLGALLDIKPDDRQWVLEGLTDQDRLALFAVSYAELGSAYGLWQDDPVGFTHLVLGQATWSLQRAVIESPVKHPRVGVPSCMEVGKATTLDTPLPTPTGWSTMGDLRVGDYLLNEDGAPVRATYLSPIRTLPCWRVTMSDGTSVVVSGDHRWTAARSRVRATARMRRHGPATSDWRERWDLAETLTTSELAARVDERWVIPNPRPFDLPDADLPVDPYVLGVWLGDGTTVTGAVTIGHQDAAEMQTALAACGESVHEVLSQRRDGASLYRIGGLTKRLADLGVLGCKRIPAAYLRGSRRQRLALLRGLMDTDGFAMRGVLVGIELSDEDLAADVAELLRTLGAPPRVRTGGTLSGRTRWRANYTLDECPFALARKAARWTPRRSPRATARTVVSVVRTVDQPTRCVSVDSPRHLYLAGKGMVPTHNTFSAACVILHHCAVWPVGTARAVSTATRQRQVDLLLWPEIRALHTAARLPGTVSTRQWKMPKPRGDDEIVAYGFTAPKNDEAAVQGIHKSHLLIVIDEAGGIAQTVGKAFVGLVTSDGTALLAIGNPPSDNEASWFEGYCHAQDTHEIVLDALQSPNVTGEVTELCRAHPDSDPHSTGSHLISLAGIRALARDHGKESPWFQAKIRGRFPRGGPSRVIPSTWLDIAREAALEVIPGRPTDASRDKLGTPYKLQPEFGAWIRLGVDVAANGGDELAIARSEGDVARIVHTESGPTLANAVDVAGIVLREIVAAQRLAMTLRTPYAVRVKIDAIGVGWGVASILERWADEGMHDADIVRVVVSEGIEEERKPQERRHGDGVRIADVGNLGMQPRLKRDELWLVGRTLVTPDENGTVPLALDIDERTYAQLGAPRQMTNSDGTMQVESKKSMKGRGLSSPDRAEALLLAVYEPVTLAARRRSVLRGSL